MDYNQRNESNYHVTTDSTDYSSFGFMSSLISRTQSCRPANEDRIRGIE